MEPNELPQAAPAKKPDSQLLLVIALGAGIVLLAGMLLLTLLRPAPEPPAPPQTEAVTQAPTEPVDPKTLRPEDRTPTQSITMLCVGDNLMHNTVMWSGQTEDGGYDFRPMYRYVKDEISAADLAVINQETIYINDPEEFTNYPSFGGPVQIGEALIDTGFDVVLQATNHCLDKGSRGILDTIAFWRQHPEMTFLGIHDSQADADTIRVVECQGMRIAMLNYTYGTNAGLPPEDYMIDYLDDEDRIAAQIAQARAQADLVLVFPHWGSENTFAPDDFQRRWARFFADQGVDAVIGGHTHTLQPLEILTGKDGNHMPVYWSLGNFVSHMAAGQNMLGGMACLTISRDDYGVYVSDCSLRPTMTYGTHDFGRWEFYPMALEDYTDDMAAHHLIDNTSVEEMWELYHEITGQ